MLIFIFGNYPLILVFISGHSYMSISAAFLAIVTSSNNNNERSVLKVLNVKPVKHKGLKRKLLLAEDGTVYKVKRSKMENNVKAKNYLFVLYCYSL